MHLIFQLPQLFRHYDGQPTFKQLRNVKSVQLVMS